MNPGAVSVLGATYIDIIPEGADMEISRNDLGLHCPVSGVPGFLKNKGGIAMIVERIIELLRTTGEEGFIKGVEFLVKASKISLILDVIGFFILTTLVFLIYGFCKKDHAREESSHCEPFSWRGITALIIGAVLIILIIIFSFAIMFDIQHLVAPEYHFLSEILESFKPKAQ